MGPGCVGRNTLGLGEVAGHLGSTEIDYDRFFAARRRGPDRGAAVRRRGVWCVAGLAPTPTDQASCWSMKAVSWALLMAPTLVAASWPSLKTMRVGMPRMPNLAGTSRFSSTFILATCSLPW